MIITICSYPRSGRHRMAAAIYSLSNWQGMYSGFRVPVSVGLFDGFLDGPPERGFQEEKDVLAMSNLSQIYEYMKRGSKTSLIYLMATHLPPHRVPGPKLVVVRDPREVAVSYSHWWAKTAGLTEKQRLVFLEDWVRLPACEVKQMWRANISRWDWEDWHASVNGDEPFIWFPQINPESVSRMLRDKFWVDTIPGESMEFGDLHKKDPVMYRRGKPCLDEFPETLKQAAQDRWSRSLAILAP